MGESISHPDTQLSYSLIEYFPKSVTGKISNLKFKFI